MGVPATTIALPEGLKLFVFGSALGNLATAGDLDVVFLFDRERIPVQTVYETIAPIRTAIEDAVQLRVHPAVLTLEEARQCQFLEDNNCVPFETFAAKSEIAILLSNRTLLPTGGA